LDGPPSPEDVYTHLAPRYAYEGFYITFGSWDLDKALSNANYAESGYGFSWQDIDFSVAIVNSDDLFVSEDTFADNAITFSISKSIAIGQ
jgi:hypothetical protein